LIHYDLALTKLERNIERDRGDVRYLALHLHTSISVRPIKAPRVDGSGREAARDRKEWCLVRIQPSPVVQLNRAMAIAMRDGPEAGLTHIDAVLEHGELANYYLAHSARADMYRRLGRTAEARSSYEKALALTQQEPERQFLQERIRQLK
jgi:tetratricopeptide (TPR) repeat protein